LGNKEVERDITERDREEEETIGCTRRRSEIKEKFERMRK